MRLVSRMTVDGPRCGVAIDSRVVDAAHAAHAGGLDDHVDWTSTRAVLAAGPVTWSALAAAAEELVSAADEGAIHDLADVRLGPPVGDPDKIICLGLNYRAHAEEAKLPLPAAPTLFAKFRNSLIGPADPIELPAVSQAVDYEAELAVVIGRRTRHVDERDALSCVAGVMALNDVSARDLQMQTSQWTAGKALDTFAPCGPSLVLLDEIDDVQALRIRTRLNGETVQDGSTAQMIFGVAETVAYLSRLMTLEPGDIVATGTPAGVGWERDPRLVLGAGDVVEVEIEGVGTLRNDVVAAQEIEHGR